MATDSPFVRATEPDGSRWVNAEAFDEVVAALECVLKVWDEGTRGTTPFPEAELLVSK